MRKVTFGAGVALRFLLIPVSYNRRRGMVPLERTGLLDLLAAGPVIASAKDDAGLAAAISSIEKHLSPECSDLMEVLHSLMPKIIRRVCSVCEKPGITGGLITDKEDLTHALSAGAGAVSTTNPDMWSM